MNTCWRSECRRACYYPGVCSETADHPAITRTRARAQADWGWTDEQTATWDRSADCPHTGFYALDTPLRPMEECPDCGQILRTINDLQSRIDTAAEERKDQRAQRLAQLQDREEDLRWG